ncbi:hypothetical protein GT360_16605 [Vibrio astriarenae]|uniref:Uncharacterized protein n=1 Tax=Vibrio astriarenae TaxID=1481923 RepID=A0A7Z2T6I0_9VIBR|nr:hypothetical protein [Vibrio astriarenae]QIA65175.1 hypothetical protein GT360_16605 [Vibrio astriarenae]
MIDMEELSKSMEFNHTGMQLLLVDYLTHFKCPISHIQTLCEKEDYYQLMTYANQLRLTLMLLNDSKTPLGLARLEHLAKYEFYPPEDLINDISVDLDVIEQQILQLTQ